MEWSPAPLVVFKEESERPLCSYWIGKACAAPRTSIVSGVRLEGGARVEEFHVVAARGP